MKKVIRTERESNNIGKTEYFDDGTIKVTSRFGSVKEHSSLDAKLESDEIERKANEERIKKRTEEMFKNFSK